MLKELWKPIAKEYINSGKMTEEFFNGVIQGSLVDFMSFLDKD